MDFDYQLIRSRRKTVCIEITGDGKVIIRSPLGMSQREIDKFIEQKRPWILKHLGQIDKRKKTGADRLSDVEIKHLAGLARVKIPMKAAHFAEVIGVTYGKITIKKQISRWGSCSSKGNLSFNFLLILCPDDVQNYIVIHELCHLVHMNHSEEFWSMVESFCPNYNIHKRWLKDNGSSLIERIK